MSEETARMIKACSAAVVALMLLGSLLWYVILIGAEAQMWPRVNENHEAIEENKATITVNTFRLSAVEEHVKGLRCQIQKSQCLQSMNWKQEDNEE